MTANWLFDKTLSSLELDRCMQIFGHLFACKADQGSIEIKPEVGLESDVDLFL